MSTFYRLRKLCLSVILFLAIPISLNAAEKNSSAGKLRLVVMDLKAKGGVSKVVTNSVSDLLRSDIVDTGRFIVAERSQLEAIFKEQELQMSGCTDTSCAVEIGKLVSANKIILGEVNQLDKSIIITVRIVDVQKGVAEFSTSAKTDNINDIDKTVKKIVENLTLRITGKKPIEDYEKPAGYYWRGIAPGWAQIYSGHEIKGWVFAGISIASAAYLGWSVYDYNSKASAYDNLDSSASADEFSSKYNAKKDAALRANIGVYLFLGFYAVNWIDVIFFNKYMPDSTAMFHEPEGCYFTVNMFDENQYEPGINLTFGYNLKF